MMWKVVKKHVKSGTDLRSVSKCIQTCSDLRGYFTAVLHTNANTREQPQGEEILPLQI